MCLSIPARVDKIEGDKAICSVGGSTYETSLEMLTIDDIHVGDYILMHTGFAIQKLDEEEALETLRTFDEFKKLNEQMDAEEKDTNTRLI